MEYSERPEANDVLFISQSGNNFDYATINALKGINNEHSLFLLILSIISLNRIVDENNTA